MGLSDYARQAGREIALAAADSLPDVLNQHLAKLLGPPYSVSSAFVVDDDGARTDEFASVVFVDRNDAGSSVTQGIPADRCAAVVDGLNTLDTEGLEASYQRIALAKRLRKSPAPKSTASSVTTITLGVILAQRSALSMDHIIHEVERLNAMYDSCEWPDMVVVSSVAVINYAVQFPGESVGGDFLPPATDAFVHSVPPIYIVPVLRPTVEDSFNRMVAYLLVHLAIFSPGAQLPDRVAVLEHVTDQVITGVGYQYNLKGMLVPVPRELHIDRQLPSTPLRIENEKGNLLATVQYVTWQDGGVIILKGKFPLEALLMLGGNDLLRQGSLTRPPDIQMSNVLPLSHASFIELLGRFQQQSNMVIRQCESVWTLQKTANEGTETPIIGRLYFGILRLREVVCQDEKSRLRFDELYEVVLSAFMSARATAKDIGEIWKHHSKGVASARIARVQGRTINIDESKDNELRSGIESFANSLVRAVKQGIQRLVEEYQINIGFLFQKEQMFSDGLAMLESNDPLLAEYLRHTRSWTEPLIKLRNDIEHEGWILPKVTYSIADSGVVAKEPMVQDIPLTEYVNSVLDRVACFVEDMTTYSLKTRMPTEITLTENPVAERSGSAPERFRITLASGGLAPWQIRYLEVSFEER